MGFEPLSKASKLSIQAQTQWHTLHVGENTRLFNFNHLFPANFPIASQKRFLPIPDTPVFFVFLLSRKKVYLHLGNDLIN